MEGERFVEYRMCRATLWLVADIYVCYSGILHYFPQHFGYDVFATSTAAKVRFAAFSHLSISSTTITFTIPVLFCLDDPRLTIKACARKDAATPSVSQGRQKACQGHTRQNHQGRMGWNPWSRDGRLAFQGMSCFVFLHSRIHKYWST